MRFLRSIPVIRFLRFVPTVRLKDSLSPSSYLRRHGCDYYKILSGFVCISSTTRKEVQSPRLKLVLSKSDRFSGRPGPGSSQINELPDSLEKIFLEKLIFLPTPQI